MQPCSFACDAKAPCEPVLTGGSNVFVTPMQPLPLMSRVSEMLQLLVSPAGMPRRNCEDRIEKPCLTHEGIEERMATKHQDG